MTQVLKKCRFCRSDQHDVRHCLLAKLATEKKHSKCLTDVLSGSFSTISPCSNIILRQLYRQHFPYRRLYYPAMHMILSLNRFYREYLRKRHPEIQTFLSRAKRKSQKCPICLTTKPGVSTDCNHPMCHGCFYQFLDKSSTLSCPLCRHVIKAVTFYSAKHFTQMISSRKRKSN